MNPFVSILMTAYNREKFIAEAIESVLNSSYENFELIIVDDASTDNTVLLASKYVKLDTRVKLYINNENLGDYKNRNRAISYATGEFIMFLDSDDFLFPNGIKDCVDLMLKYPFSSFGLRYFHDNRTSNTLSSEEAIRSHFFTKPFLMTGPGGTILKREFMNKVNCYPIKYGPANDLYFNLKAASFTPVVLIPFEYMHYRRHEGQQLNNKFSYLFNSYLYLNDALIEINLPLTSREIKYLHKKNKRRFLVNIYRYFISTGNLHQTHFALKQARFNLRDFFSAVFH
jgi:glycosyltransferase involved in cell wall biosynthesis